MQNIIERMGIVHEYAPQRGAALGGFEDGANDFYKWRLHMLKAAYRRLQMQKEEHRCGCVSSVGKR